MLTEKRTKRLLKATSFVLFLTVLCGIIDCAPASRISALTTGELENKISQIEEENKKIEQQIAGIEGDIADNKELQDLYYSKLVSTKEQIDFYNNLLYYKEEEITEKQEEIDNLDKDIVRREDEISDKNVKIELLTQENEDNVEKFGEIVRAMYITDDIDIISVLAESSDFFDLMVRAKLLTNITAQNMKFMDDLKSAIENIRVMISELETEITQLDADKRKSEAQKLILEAERAELQEKRAEVQELNSSYNSDYNTYSSLISDFEYRQEQLNEQKKANAEEIAEYEKLIEQMIKQAQQGSTQTYDNGAWLWPVASKFHYITTYFGYDAWRNGNHSGIDIGNAGINGTSIYASKSGTVIKAKTSYVTGYSYGKYVVIDHGDGYSTLYGHCSEIYVKEGQSVSQGDIIAAVGSTGYSTGPHLHFEVRVNGIAKNPFDYVEMPG